MCGAVRGRRTFTVLPPFYPDGTHMRKIPGSPVLPYCKQWKAEQLTHNPILILQLDGTRFNTSPFLFCSVSLTRPTSCGTTSPRRGSSPSGSLEGRTLPILSPIPVHTQDQRLQAWNGTARLVAPNVYRPPALVEKVLSVLIF